MRSVECELRVGAEIVAFQAVSITLLGGTF